MTHITDLDSEMESGVDPSMPPASSMLSLPAPTNEDPSLLDWPSMMSPLMLLTIIHPDQPIDRIDNTLLYNDLYAKTLPYGDDTPMDDKPSS